MKDKGKKDRDKRQADYEQEFDCECVSRYKPDMQFARQNGRCVPFISDDLMLVTYENCPHCHGTGRKGEEVVAVFDLKAWRAERDREGAKWFWETLARLTTYQAAMPKETQEESDLRYLREHGWKHDTKPNGRMVCWRTFGPCSARIYKDSTDLHGLRITAEAFDRSEIEFNKPTGFKDEAEARKWLGTMDRSSVTYQTSISSPAAFVAYSGRIPSSPRDYAADNDSALGAITNLRDKLEPGWRVKEEPKTGPRQFENGGYELPAMFSDLGTAVEWLKKQKSWRIGDYFLDLPGFYCASCRFKGRLYGQAAKSLLVAINALKDSIEGNLWKRDAYYQEPEKKPNFVGEENPISLGKPTASSPFASFQDALLWLMGEKDWKFEADYDLGFRAQCLARDGKSTLFTTDRDPLLAIKALSVAKMVIKQ